MQVIGMQGAKNKPCSAWTASFSSRSGDCISFLSTLIQIHLPIPVFYLPISFEVQLHEMLNSMGSASHWPPMSLTVAQAQQQHRKQRPKYNTGKVSHMMGPKWDSPGSSKNKKERQSCNSNNVSLIVIDPFIAPSQLLYSTLCYF